MGCGMEHGHGHGGHGGHGGMGAPHHCCPTCGMPHGGHGGHGEMGPLDLVHKAKKKVLMEKLKAKIEARWGDKLDAVAEEMVGMMEEKMKMKKEMWQRQKEMKMRLHSIMADEGEAED